MVRAGHASAYFVAMIALFFIASSFLSLPAGAQSLAPPNSPYLTPQRVGDKATDPLVSVIVHVTTNKSDMSGIVVLACFMC